MEPDEPGRGRPTGPATTRIGSRDRWIFLVGFVALIILLAWFAAAAGVRGTDQYWYLADTETLIRDHAVTTNVIFPVGLLGASGTLAPPFVHNVLSIYLAAIPALIGGSYAGWLVLNVIATLATAGLIYLAARTVASGWAALLCAVAYPLLPVTFWHMTQPLSEVSTAFFASLAIYLLAIAGTSAWRWLAVVGAVGLLYYSRESYLPLLLAVPLGFVVARAVEAPGGFRTALGPTLALVVAAVATAGLGRIAFGAVNVDFSYARLAQTAVPGATGNMWFNFDLSPANLADDLPFRLDLLPGKLIGHLAEQFVTFDSAPFAVFFWTFNLLTLVALVMLWRCRRRPRQARLIVAALAMVAIHLVTITLFQNQVRYTVPALPGLLVVLAIALSEVRALDRWIAPRPLMAAVLLVVVAALPLAGLAWFQRSDARAAAEIEKATRTMFERHVADDQTAMIVYASTPQLLGYAARPRPVLYTSPDYTAADYDRLLSAFPTHWLLAPTTLPGLDALPLASGTPVDTIETSGTEWGLYELRE